MSDKKVRSKSLEDHEPGATRDEVMAALKRTALPAQDKDVKKPER